MTTTPKTSSRSASCSNKQRHAGSPRRPAQPTSTHLRELANEGATAEAAGEHRAALGPDRRLPCRTRPTGRKPLACAQLRRSRRAARSPPFHQLAPAKRASSTQPPNTSRSSTRSPHGDGERAAALLGEHIDRVLTLYMAGACHGPTGGSRPRLTCIRSTRRGARQCPRPLPRRATRRARRHPRRRRHRHCRRRTCCVPGSITRDCRTIVVAMDRVLIPGSDVHRRRPLRQ